MSQRTPKRPILDTLRRVAWSQANNQGRQNGRCPTGGSIGKVWFFSKHFSKPLGNSQHPWLAAAPVLRAALEITCRLLLGLLATQCGHPLPASGDMTLNTQKDPCHWRQQGSTTFPLRPDPFPTPPCHTLCSPSDCAYPASYACSQDLIPNP